MWKVLSIIEDRVAQGQLLSSLKENAEIREFKTIDRSVSFDDDIDFLFIDDQIFDEPGLELVSRLQEEASKTEIVYLCKKWLETSRFTWLRDVLGVSMVIFLPINHDLLIERLRKTGCLAVRNEFVAKLDDTTGSDALIDDQSLSEDEKKKIAFQRVIFETQKRLRLEVEAEWDELHRLVLKVLEENDSVARQTLIREAHKLKGSAGSLALDRVSVCAGKIEKYLRLFQPPSLAGRGLLKAEILRQLAIGRDSMHEVESVERRLVEQDSGNDLTILLVGQCNQELHLLDRAFQDSLCERVYLDDPIQLIEVLNSVHPDVLALTGEMRFLSLFDVCRQIHDSERWKQLPILFLQSEGTGIAYGATDMPEYVQCFPLSKTFSNAEVARLLSS